MHQYSVDYDRKIIYFLLASLSVFITGIIKNLFDLNGIGISVTGFTVFGFVFLIFDKFLWKWSVLYKLGLIKTPNLNGIWEGTLSSSYHDFKTPMPACIEIKQTWTQICIFAKFNQSRSYSISANLEVNNGARIVLSYVYLNKNRMTRSKGTMSAHSGITTLDFSLTEGLSEGKYYNEPPQNVNYGELQLKRQIKKQSLVSRFKKKPL
ncbi:hypothetical protein LG296_20680 (plasmid) [Ureibacillus chungkukjangi]|uniref:Cap15 family cyclic dinucleotide receptor domain-containing protein n=1 Tax=Ureibacillus chungkukjangi TaxID=1202712 RepID=UPI000D345964|nr:hypothetical protein [Ureibacillus chungkukjangi]